MWQTINFKNICVKSSIQWSNFKFKQSSSDQVVLTPIASDEYSQTKVDDCRVSPQDGAVDNKNTI